MTCFINVLHTIVTGEALTLVKRKGAGDPGLFWVSCLCTTSVVKAGKGLCVPVLWVHKGEGSSS